MTTVRSVFARRPRPAVRSRWTVLAALACSLSLAFVAGAGTSATDPLPRGPLKVQGRWFVDTDGRAVILHGLNGVWKTGKYAPPDTPEGFQAADAKFLEDLGLNAFRLGWIWKGLEPDEPGASNHAQVEKARTDYLDAIARVERLLADHGSFVLVDSHQDLMNERFSGEGFPDWATIDDGIPLGYDAGFPGNYLTPAVSHAFDGLWLNRQGLWRAYAQAWKAVASRFAQDPMVLGYDLLNEPWPGGQYPTCAQPAGCPAFDATLFQGFQDEMARAVRTVDPKHIVFYEPHVLFNFGAASWLRRPPTDVGNPGLSFHDYCLTGDITAITGSQQLGDAGVQGCPAMDGLVMKNAEITSSRMWAAPLLSEFGAGDDLIELERYIELADSNMVGWMYWQYKNWHDPTGAPGTEGLFANDGDPATIKVAKARILSRTYPMAVAGTPISYSFNPSTEVFTMQFTPGGAITAPTVIYVPAGVTLPDADHTLLHYPKGYTVKVDGPATVTSGPDARYLTLTKAEGTGTVTVTVTPNS